MELCPHDLAGSFGSHRPVFGPASVSPVGDDQHVDLVTAQGMLHESAPTPHLHVARESPDGQNHSGPGIGFALQLQESPG